MPTRRATTVWPRFILPITGYFRQRRSRLLLRSFPGLSTYLACDLGGSKHFWQSMPLEARPRRVEVLNIDRSEIDAAGVSDDPEPERFSFEVYDGRHIERPDGHYDLLLCNSVLEHVEPAARVALATEMGRVARRLFVQTPAKAFPVDPHFVMPLVHWVPRPIGRWLARISPWRVLTRADADEADRYFRTTRLLTRRELARLFPGGTVHVERFLGWPKSYVLVVNERASASPS